MHLIALLLLLTPSAPLEAAPTPEVKSVGQAYVYQVNDESGLREYVSLLPPERIGKGLPPVAVIGMLRRRLDEGGDLTFDNVQVNARAIAFLHEFIARTAPTLEPIQAAARDAAARGDRFLNYIDGRTARRQDAAEEDRIGTFEVVDGRIGPKTWRPNPAHRAVSDAGVLQLDSLLLPLYLDALLAQPLNERPR